MKADLAKSALIACVAALIFIAGFRLTPSLEQVDWGLKFVLAGLMAYLLSFTKTFGRIYELAQRQTH